MYYVWLLLGNITLPAGVVAKYCDEYVCLSVCEDISRTTRTIFTKFLCVLPVSMARSSSGMLTIGRITYWREGGDGSAQRGRCVIYNCLVDCCPLWLPYVIGKAIIFLPCGYYLSVFLSFFPRLISAAVDWMSTILPHMVWP